MLILRCQAGDEAALTELIARYSPGVRVFLGRISGAETADDLLQDTWFDVYRQINRLKKPEAFVAWLYRIARDKAYRELRRRHVPAELLDDDLIEEPSTEQENFSPEEIDQLRASLSAIAVEHREVLVLRFMEQMSYEEIAEVIGRPLGTVRSRIHHAKLALRTKMNLSLHRKEVSS
ncbi:MAG TPA: sigma-70 family RNA polymerase sigma factor [Tepidisphaeraceae bacterium]